MSLLSSIVSLLRFRQRNWKAVFLCIAAAMIFWFFNALNKNYTSNISFPLTFEYDELYYIPVKPLPEEVRINVTGNGWNLFRKSVRLKIPPLVIPLERPTDVKKIVGSTLPALFSNQLEALQINFVVVDTLYVYFEPKVKRWLSLAVDSPEKYMRNNYCLASEISLTPDSIFIEGPISAVMHLQEPYRISLNTQGIDDDYNENIEVKLANGELIVRDPPTVNVSFEVEKLVEASDKIKLDVINIPSTSVPQVNAKEITMVFRGPQSEIQALRPNSIRATLDLKELKRGRSNMVPRITGLPRYVEVVKLDTIRITY